MAVSYGSGNVLFSGNGTSWTGALTVSGSDALLLVTTRGLNPTADISSVAYAGAGLTDIGNDGAGVPNRMWRKTAPSAGSNNLVITFSQYGRTTGTWALFNGVDGTTPCGTVVSATGSSSTPSTGSITCPANGMIYGGMWHGYHTGTPTINTGTLIVAYRDGASGINIANAYNNTTSALAWNSGSAGWSAIGVPINPVASAAFIAAPHKTILGIAGRRSNEY